jgi:hypothetical protein
MPQNLEPGDGPGVKFQDDQVPAEPSRSSAVWRLQARTGGYVARHPAMLNVLKWLGWNNPGGSMNP